MDQISIGAAELAEIGDKMSTWKPVSTAPKDRPIDLWAAGRGRLTNCYWWGTTAERGQWQSDAEDEPITDATHWKYPDKGPGQEEGEVRWMVKGSIDFISAPLSSADAAAKLAQSMNGLHESEPYRVVRVRIVREEE